MRLAMENGTFSQMIAAGVAQGSVSFYILYQPCFKQLNTSQTRATLLTRITLSCASGWDSLENPSSCASGWDPLENPSCASGWDPLEATQRLSTRSPSLRASSTPPSGTILIFFFHGGKGNHLVEFFLKQRRKKKVCTHSKP